MVKGQSRPRTLRGRRKPKWYENRAPRGVPVRVRGGPPNQLLRECPSGVWRPGQSRPYSNNGTESRSLEGLSPCSPISCLYKDCFKIGDSIVCLFFNGITFGIEK